MVLLVDTLNLAKTHKTSLRKLAESLEYFHSQNKHVPCPVWIITAQYIVQIYAINHSVINN